MRKTMWVIALVMSLSCNVFAGDVSGNKEAEILARSSTVIMKAYNDLLSSSNIIKDLELRSMAKEVLKNPAPTFMSNYADQTAKEKLRKDLIEAKYLDNAITVADLFPPLTAPNAAPQPFFAAAGSGYASHHSYPGGLVTHVAMDVENGLGYAKGFQKVYGAKLNYDLFVGAILLHDMMKPWIFQWQKDGTTLPEIKVAGTGVHHIFAIAELFYRKLPADMIMAVACSHEDVGREEEKIVGFIRAASLIANVDPISYGVLVKQPDGKLSLPHPLRPEYWVVGFGDYDWVMTSPMAKVVMSVLSDVAKDKGISSEKFNWFRNKVLSQYTTEKLYNDLVLNGTTQPGAKVSNLF